MVLCTVLGANDNAVYKPLVRWDGFGNIGLFFSVGLPHISNMSSSALK